MPPSSNRSVVSLLNFRECSPVEWARHQDIVDLEPSFESELLLYFARGQFEKYLPIRRSPKDARLYADASPDCSCLFLGEMFQEHLFGPVFRIPHDRPVLPKQFFQAEALVEPSVVHRLGLVDVCDESLQELVVWFQGQHIWPVSPPFVPGGVQGLARMSYCVCLLKVYPHDGTSLESALGEKAFCEKLLYLCVPKARFDKDAADLSRACRSFAECLI